MTIGAVVLAVGYALLWLPTDNEYFLYFALGVIIVGNGLFKPNAGNLVRKIYEGDESRIDSAFTMYYMAVNIGSMISMTLTPWIRDYVGEHYGDSAGWHTAFGVCSIGLLIGHRQLCVDESRAGAHRLAGGRGDPSTRGGSRPSLGGAVGMVAHLGVHPAKPGGGARLRLCRRAWSSWRFSCISSASSHRDERAGLIAALVLVVQTIFFFIFYQQMSTSLNLFAQKNVDLNFSLFGWHLFTWIPEQYQNLNSIWIVVLSPVLVFIYNTLGRLGKDPSIAVKFAWGFSCVAIGFFIYGVGARWAVNGQVSSWIMVWGYGLYSLGELLVSGLGLAMIARYVPARMGGFMMGAYFVASGLSQYLGSVVANFAHIPENLNDPVESLTIYTALFNKLGFAGITCTLIAIAMLPLMKKLSASHSETANGHTPAAAGAQRGIQHGGLIQPQSSSADTCTVSPSFRSGESRCPHWRMSRSSVIGRP